MKLTRLTKVPEQLDALRRWEGAPIPRGLRRRVLRGYAQHQLLRAQMAAVAAARRAVRHSSQDTRIEPGRQLLPLRGIGITGAWAWVMACFAWRACKHRREVGG